MGVWPMHKKILEICYAWVLLSVSKSYKLCTRKLQYSAIECADM